MSALEEARQEFLAAAAALIEAKARERETWDAYRRLLVKETRAVEAAANRREEEQTA